MSPQIAQPPVTQGAKTARHHGPAVSQSTQDASQPPPHTQRLPKAKGLPPENEPISNHQKTVGQTSGSPGKAAESSRPHEETAPGDRDHGDSLARDAFRRWMEFCLPGAEGGRPEQDGPALPPDSEAIPANGESIDQKKRDRLTRLAAEVETRGELLAGQGSIVASWRTYKGKRLGPYYRLAYREDGRQKSIYLGASAWVADQVRGLLAKLQTPRLRSITIQRARQLILASLRRHQARARRWLEPLGVRVSGFEYPGLLRYLQRLRRSREEAARERRSEEAWRVITGAEQDRDAAEPRPPWFDGTSPRPPSRKRTGHFFAPAGTSKS